MNISIFKKIKSSIGAEKRRDERVDFFQSSYCLKPDEGDSPTSHECWFKNISNGGVLIETKAKLEVGDTLRLLYRKGTQYCNDEVKVVYIRKIFDSFNYGCSFISADSARGESPGVSVG